MVRDDWGRLLSLLVARFHRLDLAEDALADAVAENAGPAAGLGALRGVDLPNDTEREHLRRRRALLGSPRHSFDATVTRAGGCAPTGG